MNNDRLRSGPGFVDQFRGQEYCTINRLHVNRGRSLAVCYNRKSLLIDGEVKGQQFVPLNWMII